MSAPVAARLIFDNSANPYTGTGGSTVPRPGSRLPRLGDLCSPVMPSTPPAGTFWVLRGCTQGKPIHVMSCSVAATLPDGSVPASGQTIRLFVPGGGSNQAGNGDGPVTCYMGPVNPGQTHKGWGGTGEPASGYNRPELWPVDLLVLPGQVLTMIDQLCDGGSAVFHFEVDQYPLSPDQKVVKLGAQFQGSGVEQITDLALAAGFPYSTPPSGKVWVPAMASANIHTGPVRMLTRFSDVFFGALSSTPDKSAGKVLSQTGPITLPRRGNNNSTGGYLLNGTAPQDVDSPSRGYLVVFVPGEVVYPGEGVYSDRLGQLGDFPTANADFLEQLETDPMPWDLPSLA